MAKSTNINLELTIDDSTLFKDWRQSINGNNEAGKESNAQIIDREIGLLKVNKQDVISATNKLSYTLLKDVPDMLSFKIVNNISEVTQSGYIYLIKKTETEEGNTYDEYLYVENKAERIGDTKVKLDGYATTDYVDNHHDSTKQDAITTDNKLDYSLLDNTPAIPTVPTDVSSFNNDAGYITEDYHDATKQDLIDTEHKLSADLIDGDLGTIVEANPEDDSTDSLSKIKIGDTVYKVDNEELEKKTDLLAKYVDYALDLHNVSCLGDSGDLIYTKDAEGNLNPLVNGTPVKVVDVKANPETTATDTLSKIKVGDTVYNVAAGIAIETDPTVPSHVKAITEADITSWNNKSEFSGSYTDLTDKPTIPSVEGLATTDYVDSHHDDTKQDVIDSEHKLSTDLIDGELGTKVVANSNETANVLLKKLKVNDINYNIFNINTDYTNIVSLTDYDNDSVSMRMIDHDKLVFGYLNGDEPIIKEALLMPDMSGKDGQVLTLKLSVGGTGDLSTASDKIIILGNYSASDAVASMDGLTWTADTHNESYFEYIIAENVGTGKKLSICKNTIIDSIVLYYLKYNDNTIAFWTSLWPSIYFNDNGTNPITVTTAIPLNDFTANGNIIYGEQNSCLAKFLSFGYDDLGFSAVKYEWSDLTHIIKEGKASDLPTIDSTTIPAFAINAGLDIRQWVKNLSYTKCSDEVAANFNATKVSIHNLIYGTVSGVISGSSEIITAPIYSVLKVECGDKTYYTISNVFGCNMPEVAAGWSAITICYKYDVETDTQKFFRITDHFEQIEYTEPFVYDDSMGAFIALLYTVTSINEDDREMVEKLFSFNDNAWDDRLIYATDTNTISALTTNGKTNLLINPKTAATVDTVLTRKVTETSEEIYKAPELNKTSYLNLDIDKSMVANIVNLNVQAEVSTTPTYAYLVVGKFTVGEDIYSIFCYFEGSIDFHSISFVKKDLVVTDVLNSLKNCDAIIYIPYTDDTSTMVSEDGWYSAYIDADGNIVPATLAKITTDTTFVIESYTPIAPPTGSVSSEYPYGKTLASLADLLYTPGYKAEISYAWETAQSGGTTVEANPTAEATEELAKLKVGNTVYSMPTDVSADMAQAKEDIDLLKNYVDLLLSKHSLERVVFEDGVPYTLDDNDNKIPLVIDDSEII